MKQKEKLPMAADEKLVTGKKGFLRQKLISASQVKDAVRNTFLPARKKGVGAEDSIKLSAHKTGSTNDSGKQSQVSSDLGGSFEFSQVYPEPDEVKEGKSSIQSDVVKDDVKPQILLKAYESAVKESGDFLETKAFDLYEKFLKKLGSEFTSEQKLIFFLTRHYLEGNKIFDGKPFSLDLNNFESFKDYNKFIIAFKKWCNENNFNDDCILKLSESFSDDDAFTMQLFDPILKLFLSSFYHV